MSILVQPSHRGLAGHRLTTRVRLRPRSPPCGAVAPRAAPLHSHLTSSSRLVTSPRSVDRTLHLASCAAVLSPAIPGMRRAHRARRSGPGLPPSLIRRSNNERLRFGLPYGLTPSGKYPPSLRSGEYLLRWTTVLLACITGAPETLVLVTSIGRLTLREGEVSRPRRRSLPSNHVLEIRSRWW